MRIFIGFDPRQPVGLQVLMHSIYRRASQPVSITPLVLAQLPIKRQGLTQFTFSRYLVPWLCKYHGKALFLDADMLCLGDVCELGQYLEDDAAVGVVKSIARFEWPSLMLFNNALCKDLTPTAIETGTPHKLEWAVKSSDLPAQWNHVVGYCEPRKDAKLVHYTAGIPIWPETANCEYSQEWHEEHAAANSSVSWNALMGNSVHAQLVKSGKLQAAA